MDKVKAYESWLNMNNAVSALIADAITDYVSSNPDDDDLLGIICKAMKDTADGLEKKYRKGYEEGYCK